jgi:putative transposase
LDRTVRYEWLAHYEFDTLPDMQDHVANWMWFYHYDCPRMAMGGYTPKQRLAMAAYLYSWLLRKIGG